ncbi:YigZ family protein [Spiribacter halobius]|uniref:YigZ family protein n=1 Tax=Sediminicurvatus halobius TaxID=2182432 RepID=A0A2U2N3R7_9GAMM|nr:YigZ family protein [Spiribacter halobius]
MSGSAPTEAPRVPAAECHAEITVRRSRFVAVAAPAADRSAARGVVASAQDRHPGATHHCWAWQGQGSAASSDDGEPGGTAGRPILGVIGHKGISDVVVVVSRYFGGVKLGAGGLVRAYAGAAEAVLADLPVVTAVPMARLELALGFADEQPLRHWLACQDGAELQQLEYGEGVTARVTLPAAAVSELLAWSGARGVSCRQLDDAPAAG